MAPGKHSPQEAQRVSLTVRANPGTISRMKGAAYELRIPLSQLVETAMAEWLDRAEKKHGKPFGKKEKLASGRPLEML